MKRSRVLEVEIDLTKQNIELQNDESYHPHNSMYSQQNKQEDIEEDYDDNTSEFNIKNDQLSKVDEYEQNYDIDEPPLAKSMSAIALGTHQRYLSPKSGMRRVQSVGSDVLISSKSLRHTSPIRGQPNRNILSRRGKNIGNGNENEKVNSSSLKGLSQSLQSSKDVQSEIYHLQKQLNGIESSR